MSKLTRSNSVFNPHGLDRSSRGISHLLRRIGLMSMMILVPAITASAQLDRVYDKSGENSSGTVTKTTPYVVQLTRAGNTRDIPAADVLKILFEGDPAPLTKGREFAIGGEYDQALEELNNISLDALPREVIKADAAFYIAMCRAKLALQGRGNKDEAVKTMLAFASQFKNSWHALDAAKLLGDLELALNHPDKALRYYTFLSTSPSADLKIESVYLQGLVHLKKGDAATAISQFEKVIGVNAQSTQAARMKQLSRAGKALALARSGKPDEALQICTDLIEQLNTTDMELAARVYNAQGAAFEAAGDVEGAIMAYLHTHLMFSGQPDAHAEALHRLAELWPQVGKPDRAAQARQELQQRYPGM